MAARGNESSSSGARLISQACLLSFYDTELGEWWLKLRPSLPVPLPSQEAELFGNPPMFIISSFPPSSYPASFLQGVEYEFHKGFMINSSLQIVFPTATWNRSTGSHNGCLFFSLPIYSTVNKGVRMEQEEA